MTSWQLKRSGPVAVLTLQRPPINALDQEALDELARVIESLRGSATERALVVTGQPGKVFCSGGDLKYWRGIRDGRRVSESGRSVFERLERLEIPTLAAINGSVIGDGLALALACDIRVACDGASFRLPELGYGFIPGWGPIRPLIAAVGRTHAASMLLTGRTVDACEARVIGLVHEVVLPEHLEEAVLSRAGALAAASPVAFRSAKRALRGADERACFEEVWGSRDWQEGVEALLGKRAPASGRSDL